MKLLLHSLILLLTGLILSRCNSRETLTQIIDDFEPKAYVVEFNGSKQDFYKKNNIKLIVSRQDSVQKLSQYIKYAQLVEGVHNINPRPVNYTIKITGISRKNEELPILQMIQYGTKEIIDIGGWQIYNYYEGPELTNHLKTIMAVSSIKKSKLPFDQANFDELRKQNINSKSLPTPLR